MKINPDQKSDMIICYLHYYSTMFESAMALRMKLVKEFKDLFPDNLSFSVGYFEGYSAPWGSCDSRAELLSLSLDSIKPQKPRLHMRMALFDATLQERCKPQ